MIKKGFLVNIDGVNYYEEIDEELENEDEEHVVFGGKPCPFCGKPMWTDEWLVCMSLPNDQLNKHAQFVHTKCLSDEVQEALEKLGYTLIEDTGRWFE